MYKFILAIFTLLLIVTENAAASNSNYIKFEKEINHLIDEYKIPGLALAIIDKNKIIHQKNYGIISYKNNQKVDSKTIWQIASISKTFLAASLAILADKGQFSWESNIDAEIEEFELNDIVAQSKLTFHDIASMQSGLTASAGKDYIINLNNRKEIIKIFSNIKPIYPVGEGYFSYQYAIISIIEEIIENKTKKSWQNFIKSSIFSPLKLYNTGIDVHNLNNKLNVAFPYDQYNKELLWENFKINAAAGFYSNLEDMVKWLQFNMKEGKVGKKQLISIAQMQKIHKKYTPIKNFETQLFRDQNISSIYYGYFWKTLVYRWKNKDITIYEHNGNCNGMSSIISYIPERNIGIIVLSNKVTPVPEMIRSKFIQYFN
ncbi:MAG: serine hydrolase domain-containing protein [Alphaproteobacteria bacterium]